MTLPILRAAATVDDILCFKMHTWWKCTFNYFQWYNSVALSKRNVLCSHHHYVFLECFHHAKQRLYTLPQTPDSAVPRPPSLLPALGDSRSSFQEPGIVGFFCGCRVGNTGTRKRPGAHPLAPTTTIFLFQCISFSRLRPQLPLPLSLPLPPAHPPPVLKARMMPTFLAPSTLIATWASVLHQEGKGQARSQLNPPLHRKQTGLKIAKGIFSLVPHAGQHGVTSPRAW